MDYTSTTTPYELTPSGGAVTITVLPVTLGLVRIPKHRLSHFAHPIIKLILSDSTSSTFLNISTNASEVSIIAREQDLASFVKIARRDNRRIRRQIQRNARRESVSSVPVTPSSDPRAGQESGAAPSAGRPSKSRRERVLQPVEVSSSWSALQIDSHGEQLGDASARIREISWLLAGISILYQSSYTTDYIFVQSRLLPEVLSILSNANFLTLSSIPSDLSSQISSLVSSSSTSTGPSTRSTSPQATLPPEELVQADLAALGLDGENRLRARRGTASSHASLHSILLAKSASGSARSSFIETSSPKSKSPSKTELGASPTPTTTPALPQRSGTRSTLSQYRPSVTILPSDLVVVGLSEQFESHSDVWKMKLIKLLFFRDMLGERSMREEQVVEAVMDGGERGRERCRRSASESNLDEDVDVEPLEEELESEEEDGSSLGYSTSGSSSSSSSRSSSNHSFHSTKSSVSPPSSPIPSSSPTSSTSPSYPSSHMAFFSLTRTADGASLAADVHVLAKLFEGQRDLIYCGDEFERLERRDVSVGAEVDGSPGPGGFLKCLHVDLKDFDLDRHGLVNRFSDVLHSNNIHHLYCSTFKTANLLVDERDAIRAQKLLSEC